jgi:hypothetical protein
VIVAGSGIQFFLVKTIFLDGLACRIPVLLREEKTSQNGHSNVRLNRANRYGNKQSSEDIVTAAVSWSILSSHVCA